MKPRLCAAASFVGVALALSLACIPPRIGEPVPTSDESSRESAYQAVVARYTSHAEVYGGFDTRFFASATYQSPAFREARVRRQGEFQKRSREWLGQALEGELKEAAGFHDFVLGMHFNESRYEDFEKPNSIWSIALVTSAGEVAPVEIRRIGRGDQNLAAYYPYLDLFWNVYRVRFPKTLAQGGEVVPPGAERIVFRLASSLGKAELTFPAQ